MNNFSRPRKFNPKLQKSGSEISIFIEERKDEFLQWLSMKGWEDTPSRRKNFAWNHSEYPEFEFSYYDAQTDLVDMMMDRGLLDD